MGRYHAMKLQPPSNYRSLLQKSPIKETILQKRAIILWSLLIATWYGVVTISRLLQIIGLFAKEPYKRDYILQ